MLKIFWLTTTGEQVLMLQNLSVLQHGQCFSPFALQHAAGLEKEHCWAKLEVPCGRAGCEEAAMTPTGASPQRYKTSELDKP